MTAYNSKRLSFAAPVVLLLFVAKIPHGFAQTTAAVVAAVATVTVIEIAARFVWAPVFKKGGLRWATVFLVCALVTGLLATFFASAAKLGDSSGFAWDLASRCAIVGLLCSWGLAAFRGAQEKEISFRFEVQQVAGGEGGESTKEFAEGRWAASEDRS